MAWMIIRIEPRDNSSKPEVECEPPIEKLTRRFQQRQPHPREYAELLRKHGYECAPPVGPSPKDAADWPYIGFAYTSARRDGVGRNWSSLSRLLIRRLPE